MNKTDNKILSHTTWNCKYHIVFAPKYRRKIFYESHRREIMETIKELCRWKGVEIIEGEMAIDHVIAHASSLPTPRRCPRHVIASESEAISIKFFHVGHLDRSGEISLQPLTFLLLTAVPYI